MKYFEWNNSYKSGIEIIDAQHKRLMQIINGLYSSMREGKGNQVLHFIIEDLLEYTYYHFETEEKMMIENSYEEFELHRREHDLFARKMVGLKKELTENKVAVSLDVVNFLKNWWRYHILESDMKYVKCREKKLITENEL